jgi:hypothetical protein
LQQEIVLAKRTKLAPWVVVLMIAITAILYFKVSDNGSKAPQGGQDAGHHYKIEKTGAGAVVDFTAESQKIHSAVDHFINSSNLKRAPAGDRADHPDAAAQVSRSRQRGGTDATAKSLRHG